VQSGPRIHEFIIDNFLFGKGAVAYHESLLEKGIIDSSGVLELVGFLEKEFGIQVADEDLVPENLDSIDNMCRYVERKLASGKGSVA